MLNSANVPFLLSIISVIDAKVGKLNKAVYLAVSVVHITNLTTQ